MNTPVSASRHIRDNQPIFHWLPSSELGGIEVAALTLMQTTPDVRHVVATADISGPAVALWRQAGAEVVHIHEWHALLGLKWASNWRQFVSSRRISRLVAWSPTRMTLLLAPLDKETSVVVHLGSVGALSGRARWQEKIARLILRPACRPRLVACSHAAGTSAGAEPIFAGLSLKVIPNAVRPHFFEVGAARKSPGGRLRLWGLHARLVGGKNHARLIEAFGLLPADPDLCLELVGDGPMKEELVQQAEAAGLQDRVRFLGALAEPADALRRWDAYVFMPSPEEGFGIAAAEAMAAGLPCVFADVPSLREVAGDMALYAAHASAEEIAARMREVMASPLEAAAKATAGRQRATELFGAEKYAKAYLETLG
jgi:glycosyltransferase involved in cell wall biosynthesis